MSEGTPSIVGIIAPGKTGLSEEEWGKSLELLARLVRSRAEKTTLVPLSAFLRMEGMSSSAIEKAIGSTAACLKKQGIFFSANSKSRPPIIDWLVWGVCRDDDLFLGHVILNRQEDTFVIETFEPTPKNVFDKTKEEPFTLCCRMANATGAFVDRAQSNLIEALTTKAKAMMVLEDLRRFSN
jgi:hypothetical protein